MELSGSDDEGERHSKKKKGPSTLPTRKRKKKPSARDFLLNEAEVDDGNEDDELDEDYDANQIYNEREIDDESELPNAADIESDNRGRFKEFLESVFVFLMICDFVKIFD